MDTKIYTYRVTIGDYSGNAGAVLTDDLGRAEDYAAKYLGRGWGDSRMISLARIYKWNGSAYLFDSEMEY